MAAKKQKDAKSSASSRSGRPAKASGPAAKANRSGQEIDSVDKGLDKREVARKNLKPRSAREALVRPNDRKGAGAKRAPK